MLFAFVHNYYICRLFYLTRKRSFQVDNDQNDHSRDLQQPQSNYYRADRQYPSSMSIEVSTDEMPLSGFMNRLLTGGMNNRRNEPYPNFNDEHPITAKMKSRSLVMRSKHHAVGKFQSRVKRVTNHIQFRSRKTYSGSRSNNSSDKPIELKPVNDLQSDSQNNVDFV